LSYEGKRSPKAT